MLGRGIDQVLRHPGDSDLYEPLVGDARDYVALAESANGPIPKPVGDRYVWGDAISAMEHARARIINLETSITTSHDFAPKGINYKMNPKNIGCLTAAGVDCCVLANNHVLDWGVAGLVETLEALQSAGIHSAGAGRNAAEAAAPAIVDLGGGHRVLVFGFALESSGVPPSWSAGPSRPGVNLLSDPSEKTIAAIADRARMARRDGDLLIASLHWGGNWGYAIPPEHRILAHRLIDAGFAVIHGHSSHHPLAVEIYQGRPVLYGCGDFISDYEGIAGYEAFRGDLAILYLPQLLVPSGALISLTMHSFCVRNFRLHHASAADAAWLQTTLDRESTPFGTRMTLEAVNLLSATW